MKKLDKMDSRMGRKDIDYILATPFIDEDSVYSNSKASSSNLLGKKQNNDKSNMDGKQLGLIENHINEGE